MIRNSLPVSADQVQQVLNQTSLNYFKSSDKLIDMEFFDRKIRDLRELRGLVYDQEIDFFSELGIITGTSKERLEELQNRIKEINQLNQKFSIETFQNNIMNDPNIIATIDNLDWNVIKERLENIEWELKDFDGSASAEDQLLSEVIEKFNEKISYTSGKRKSNFFVDSINWSKKTREVGLRRIFTIEIDATKKTYSIKAKDDKVSLEIKNKLFSALQAIVLTSEGKERGKVIAANQFKKYVTDQIIKYVGEDQNFGQYISKEVDRNYDKYDLSRSFASLKGFLEEVWANALLNYLFRNYSSFKSIPTGNLKNIIGSKGEIPVDTVLRDFHFQIKSYTLENGQYNIQQSNKVIGTLIKDRAQMDIANLLITFFATYQFNQPFNEPINEKPYKSSYRSWIDLANYEQNIYSGFDDLETKFEPVFNAYIDRIIGLDKIFQTKNNLFAGQALYFNTFFIVNNKFIPSSAILDAIIYNFEQELQENIIRLSITSIKNDQGAAGYTFEKVIRNDHFIVGKENNRPVKGKGSIENPVSILDVANQVRMSYNISLNFDEILNRAYNEAIKN